MIFHKFSVSVVLFSFVVLAAGCSNQDNRAKPTNPFAHNLKTVPPPATFSSQESYLGQTPGTFVPQTPATTFPSHPLGTTPSPQPETPPANVFSSNTSMNNPADSHERATVFTPSEPATAWTPADVTTTSHTAFQAIAAKAHSTSSQGNATPAEASDTLIVGTSHAVTTIADESPPIPALNTPQPLYSGQFTAQ